MSQLIGGYLFVPTSRFTLDELFLAVLQQFGASEDIFIYPRGPQKAQYVPFDEVLSRLRQSGGGRAEVDLGKLEVDIEYELNQPQGTFLMLEVSVSDYLISYLNDDEQLQQVETFVQRWLACCVAVDATFAYFSKGEIFIEPPYRDKMLAAVQAQDLDVLLHNLAMDWLVYLGPALGTQAVQEALARTQQKDAFLRYIKQHVLDSGAVFLRMGRDASLGNEDEDF